MVKSIAIVGVASPYSWDLVETANRAGFAVRCVDNFGGADPLLPGLTVLDTQTDRSGNFVLGLSSAVHRAAAATALFDAGFYRPIALIDPSCSIASTSEIRHGAYVNAGSVVASNSIIGCHVNINRSVSIGHDNRIEFAASIGPGAVLTGGITVDPGATIGAGAVVLPGITIGRGAIVGAGTVVTKPVRDFELVVGNPGRFVRSVQLSESSFTCPHC